MNYSYERVSTAHQDERRQEISLEPYKIDRRYIDKLTGKNANRPELQRLLVDAKSGDHIYIESISRLGRNVDDLRNLTEQFRAAGATVHFIKEGFDTNGSMYKFTLTILGAVAEMEREIIVERVFEGLEKARRYGTRSGNPIGRPPVILSDEFKELYRQVQAGKITKVDAAKVLKIGRKTLYRWIEQYETEKAG
jgi:DNA invertase Pin-like site-specific DNA recombinase